MNTTAIPTPVPMDFNKYRLLCDLYENSKPETMIGLSIRHAIDKEVPYWKIFAFIKSQSKINPGAVASCITEKITKRILAL